MVSNSMKTDAQRLGNGKKAFNVKQIEKMLESAGTEYTAGTGIDITENVISVDTTEIQGKLTASTGIDITEDVISVDTTAIQEKLTAGSGITIDSSNVISALASGSWHLETSTDWSSYFNLMQHKVSKEIIIILFDTDYNYYLLYFTPDMYINAYMYLSTQLRNTSTTSNNLYTGYSLDINNNLFTSSANVSVKTKYLVVDFDNKTLRNTDYGNKGFKKYGNTGTDIGAYLYYKD